MTTFWRAGHWRTSVYGDRHWIEAHWVTRDTGSWGYSAPSTPQERQRGGSGELVDNFNPNARCPICNARVFFYQNDFGSRVYFDALGPPWPKHPCMDWDSASTGERLSAFAPTVDHLVIRAVDHAEGMSELRGASVVTAVERQGKRRLITLHEIGGVQMQVLISPPAPPVGAVVVTVTHTIHWEDPFEGSRGTNQIWWRSDGR